MIHVRARARDGKSKKVILGYNHSDLDHVALILDKFKEPIVNACRRDSSAS
jgi:hypothetical protein